MGGGRGGVEEAVFYIFYNTQIWLFCCLGNGVVSESSLSFKILVLGTGDE